MSWFPQNNYEEQTSDQIDKFVAEFFTDYKEKELQKYFQSRIKTIEREILIEEDGKIVKKSFLSLSDK